MSAELRGHYARGFEVESFRPCGQEEAWWVLGGGELARRDRELAVADCQPVYAVVRGQVGPAGRHGHLGAYTHELTVVEVLDLRRDPPGNCP